MTLGIAVREHLCALRSLGFAAGTIAARDLHLRRFLAWCGLNGLESLDAVRPRDLERYRYALLERCGRDGAPISWGTSAHHLTALRMLFGWAVRSGRLGLSPAGGLEMPRQPIRLPRAVLSEREVERVLAGFPVGTDLGLRDRAIAEALYSTGIRRMELVALDVADLQADRGLLLVRNGKGRKDRVVPIGSRALDWIARYLMEVRPRFVAGRAASALFVTARGSRIRATRLTDRLGHHIQSCGVAKPGAVHIFRHTMATLMHDGGADIRDLQEMLGHARLETTQRYTRVSIARLRRVHAETHPAERRKRG